MFGLIDYGLGWKRLVDLTVNDCDEFLMRLPTVSGLAPAASALTTCAVFEPSLWP